MAMLEEAAMSFELKTELLPSGFCRLPGLKLDNLLRLSPAGYTTRGMHTLCYLNTKQ